MPYHVLGPGDMAAIHRSITLALIDLTVDKEQNTPRCVHKVQKTHFHMWILLFTRSKNPRKNFYFSSCLKEFR